MKIILIISAVEDGASIIILNGSLSYAAIKSLGKDMVFSPTFNPCFVNKLAVILGSGKEREVVFTTCPFISKYSMSSS